MNSLMTHVVAGYPTETECIDLLKGMQKIGIDVIEVQIPFSDPIADGETIMRANDVAIENGMTTGKSFALIEKANLSADVFIMSYLQKVLAFDIKKFCRRASASGAKGLIIPDLPFDTSEYKQVLAEARKNSLEIVPVVSPGMSQARLEKAIANARGLIYLTSMKGITGKQIKLNTDLVKTAKNIKQLRPNVKLAIGFGISSKKDVQEVLKHADLAVVGSSVIRNLNQSGVKGSIDFLVELQ